MLLQETRLSQHSFPLVRPHENGFLPTPSYMSVSIPDRESTARWQPGLPTEPLLRLLNQKSTETVLSLGSSPAETVLQPPPRKLCHVMFCFSWGHTRENGVPTERSISRHQSAVGQFFRKPFSDISRGLRRLWLNIGHRGCSRCVVFAEDKLQS